MLIPSAQTLEPIRKVPARKEIFGNSQKPRFARMKKPNSVEHDENGIGELLVTSPICAETKQNGSRIALRSRLKG